MIIPGSFWFWFVIGYLGFGILCAIFMALSLLDSEEHEDEERDDYY